MDVSTNRIFENTYWETNLLKMCCGYKLIQKSWTSLQLKSDYFLPMPTPKFGSRETEGAVLNSEHVQGNHQCRKSCKV